MIVGESRERFSNYKVYPSRQNCLQKKQGSERFNRLIRDHDHNQNQLTKRQMQ